ncbi:hypothetical protein AB0F43_15590 [Kribbella sp. NPDC023972]|uniref:hypothetical protein n=1 Tax=Kribbella sp. NPDC023972 TaxID=3154795 RepID=UPI0033C195E8
MLTLLTGCSSSPDQAESSTTTSSAPTVLAPIKATQVVAGLSSAGYKCSNDGAYAICTSGAASVWVLTGDHPRPPVVSLHSAGAVETASAEIAKVLPQALEIAHINQGKEIADWFGQQKGKTTAQLTSGDWLVDYSAEVDTDEPGAHLTLTDKLCTTNCQAE